MMLLPKVLACTLVAATMLACSGATALGLSWRAKSAEGFQRRQEQNFVGAVDSYREALALMPSSAQVDERMDVELAVAQSLIDSNKTTEAEELLVSIGRNYKGNVSSGTLLAVRYFRRYRDLYIRSGRLALAAKCQGRVVQLLTELFGPGSTNTLEERCLEVDLYRRANLWSQALQTAKVLEDGLNVPLRNDARRHYEQQLTWAFGFTSTQIVSLIRTGKFDQAKKLVEELGQFRNDPHGRLAIMDALSIYSTSSESALRELAPVIGKVVIATAKLIPDRDLSKKERYQVSTALFHCGLAELLSGNKNDAAVQNLKRAVAILDDARPPIDRTTDLFYVQCFSTCARAVALSGDAAEAEKMLSTLAPKLGKFPTIDCMYGIFQARQALAALYEKKGDCRAMNEQYSRILSIVQSMPHCPDQKREYKQWKSQRDYYKEQCSRFHPAQ